MGRRVLACTLLALLGATAGRAEVSMVEHRALKDSLKSNGEKPPKATGSQTLIDNSGFEYFINTNITFSTSSSASAAQSEASYTHAVSATTLNGGNVSSTLNDAFDGYNTLCISADNTVATCETGNANFTIYNRLGAASTECPGPVSAVNRQVVFPTQTIGSLQVTRKVFVPDNDAFSRWLNYFRNTGGAPLTVTMVIANNLGSDSNTAIVSSSSGNAGAEVADTWVSTFQNFSGTTSSDPRLAHILQGPGGAVQLAGINFADGDDNPFWGYTFTVNPGETRIIMNFVTGQPSRAAAAAKAAEIVALPPNTLQCMTPTEQAQVANFVALQPDPFEVPALDKAGLLVLALGLSLAAFVVLKLR